MQLVAFVELHVNVTVPPGGTVFGLAEMVAVGADVVGGLQQFWPLGQVPEPADIPAVPQLTPIHCCPEVF